MNVLAVRMLLDQAAPTNVIDLNKSQSPSLFRGYDWEFDYGIGLNGLLVTGLATTGAGGIALLTWQLFQSENDTNAPMLSGTSTIANTALTQTEWTNDTSPYFHGKFTFTNAQTGAIPLQGKASQTYWLRIYATTSDATALIIPLAEGSITVNDAPLVTVPTPAAPGFKVVTDVATGLQAIAIQDPVTGNYYALEIDTVGGVRSLSLSDQAY